MCRGTFKELFLPSPIGPQIHGYEAFSQPSPVSLSPRINNLFLHLKSVQTQVIGFKGVLSANCSPSKHITDNESFLPVPGLYKPKPKPSTGGGRLTWSTVFYFTVLLTGKGTVHFYTKISIYYLSQFPALF